jgi:hypothetical protein
MSSIAIAITLSSIAIVTSAIARAIVTSAKTSHVSSAEATHVTSAETAHVTSSAKAAAAEAAAAVATTAATAAAATATAATASTAACLCTCRKQRPGNQNGCQYHRRSSCSHECSFRGAEPSVISDFLPRPDMVARLRTANGKYRWQ